MCEQRSGLPLSSQPCTLHSRMASSFGLGGPAAKVEIALDNDGDRKSIEVESEDAKQELMIYSGNDKVSGTVKVIIPSGKKLEHLGIKVEVIGTVGTYFKSLSTHTHTLSSPQVPSAVRLSRSRLKKYAAPA